MTKKDYIERHIPHRINLLVTYRERFANLSSEKRQLVRDFHRCSKDISILMVRFLLSELGITLKEGNTHISEKKAFRYAKKLDVPLLIKDTRYENVLAVLKAANRAVAHIEDNDVDHALVTDLDDFILYDAISYTEEQVKNLIYNSAQEYEHAMNLCDNLMHRDQLIL